MRLVSILVIMLPVGIFCRDSILNFLRRKKIKKFTIDVLKTKDNSSSNWVEYMYIFDKSDKLTIENNKQLERILNIGLVKGADDFNCVLSDDKNYTNLAGYDIDVIENLRSSLSISIQYEFIENSYDLLNTLPDKIDLIACSHHNKMGLNWSELYPTIKTNYLLVYQPNKLNFTKDIFILTFAGSLWLVFFILLLILALCLRISTRNYSTIYPKYESWTWVEITLWAIAAACQQGLSHTPSGFASCCIFLIGYLTSYLLYTGFAAAITSVLVQYDSSSFDLRKINTDRLELISLESSRPHIASFRDNFITTKYVHYVPNIETFYEHLDKHNRIGVLPQILLRTYPENKDAVYVTSKLDLTYKQGFLIRNNSPWMPYLNKQIILMRERGILQNVFRRHLRPTETLEANFGYSSAGQEHVGSANLLFLGGVLVSVLFLMAEFVLYFYQRNRNVLGL